MKTIYKIQAVISVLLLCLLPTACGNRSPEPAPTVTTVTTAASTEAVFEEPAPTEEEVYEEELPDLCAYCDRLPVANNLCLYCVNCKCLLCNELREGIGSGREFSYCLHHRCRVSNCNTAALDNSHYCSAHECIYPDCHIVRCPGSNYCGIHE